MIFGFDGPVPSCDEVAAIVAVLDAAPDKRAAETRAQVPAWRLAALLPDLEIEELRAFAHSGNHVP